MAKNDQTFQLKQSPDAIRSLLDTVGVGIGGSGSSMQGSGLTVPLNIHIEVPTTEPQSLAGQSSQGRTAYSNITEDDIANDPYARDVARFVVSDTVNWMAATPGAKSPARYLKQGGGRSRKGRNR